MKAAKLAEILQKLPEGSFVKLEKGLLFVSTKEGIVQGFLNESGIFIDTSRASDVREFEPMKEDSPQPN